MIDVDSIRLALRDAIFIARTRQLTLLSAGVAFYAFLSLVPIALLAVGVASSLGGEALAHRFSGAAAEFLTPAAQQLLADALVDDTGRRSATVVGAIGIIWGSSRVLRGLDRAFSLIYGTGGERSVLDTFWDAAVVAGAVTVGLGLVAGLELAIALAPVPGTGLVGPLFVFPALVAAFLPLYVIFPGRSVSVREALPGTMIAAVGWLALSRTFAIYAALASASAVYGALGGVLLVLIWLYLGAIVVVFGAVVNAVLADRGTDRQLQSPGSRQFGRRAMTDDATDRDGESPTSEPPTGSTTDDPGERASDATERATSAGEPSDGRRASDRTRDRADDPAALREEIERLRDELAAVEAGVESRTVRKEDLEGDLRRYVRRRVRRGKAHGWGPYLVLLYGTAMTIAAYYFLSSGWAVFAMFVIWTSTLGVYLLMVLFGTVFSVLGLPGRLRDRVGEWRS
ncbi:YihY/virulence factor BrkB family protein [Halovivax gelatinilyticus]|uniref:YihY/virulence factor BrkB family protein n=1 Tax=Halovivax gelatinilyticus TaxID=2961597 RepID=UPI0020CA5164|nr:YihY/virulence factor BrkB family protein [Halovivax gelatinilyticus]